MDAGKSTDSTLNYVVKKFMERMKKG